MASIGTTNLALSLDIDLLPDQTSVSSAKTTASASEKLPLTTNEISSSSSSMLISVIAIDALVGTIMIAAYGPTAMMKARATEIPVLTEEISPVIL